MTTHNAPLATVNVNIVDSQGNSISVSAGWDGQEFLTITGVNLSCGETYHYEYIQGLINDGALGVDQETNINPSISFSTVACPNNDPVLLSSNGNSSPYDGEALLQQTLSPHYLAMLMETQ